MILNDKWIQEKGTNLISPFVDHIVRQEGNKRVISYGCGSYGYDIRLSDIEFKVFKSEQTQALNDPKLFSGDSLEDASLHRSPKGDYFILPKYSYGLGVSLERIVIPENVVVICVGKSTYARTGVIANITPIEPKWEGHLTLEFSNSSGSDCKIYANEGIIQLLFFKGDPCNVSYQARSGKYQNQPNRITLPKV